MSGVTVYGASDDCIEVEGAITEEFTPYDKNFDGDLLAFSDGSVLRIRYTDSGVWRIEPVQTGSAIKITPALEGDEDNYSDIATVAGPVRWVVLGTEYALGKDRR